MVYTTKKQAVIIKDEFDFYQLIRTDFHKVMLNEEKKDIYWKVPIIWSRFCKVMIPLHLHVYHISMEADNLGCHHKLWEWGQGRPMQMEGEERKEKPHK